ncbi:transposable element Tcb2 transposase [Trichonephila clavipes]|uniref:Transposable element Tcb2 transposase n=1 Tax=Trichonephila clavipes TaxID=2585209 RepID=A0A8X6V9R6_TRICX|nr:transposable element Tcb2 transposase [Trichonephila clavipes]
MDDNARPHRANIVEECLQSEDIIRMDWPAYSPDLNPIEHVWDMLGRRIAARQPPPTCLPELRRALLCEWCNIPQDQIDNLILIMPRHWGVQNQKRLEKWEEKKKREKDRLRLREKLRAYAWVINKDGTVSSVKNGMLGSDGGKLASIYRKFFRMSRSI